MPDLSIVIPVYRNANTLVDLHDALRGVLGPQAEIVFVNDACPAGSLVVLRSIVAADPYVCAVSLKRNVGQNRAVMIGLRYALGPVCVVMDADLQDPPQVIPDLVRRLSPTVHAVFAGRRGPYETRSRLLTSRIFKDLLFFCSAGRIPADAGLFVALDDQMRQALLTYDDHNPYVIGLMARTGLWMTSLPVKRSANSQGESGYTFTSRLRLAERALRTLLNPFPRTRASGLPIDRARWMPAVECKLGVRFKSDKAI